MDRWRCSPHNLSSQRPALRPLPGLLHVTLNAVLYATSAGVEPDLRRPPSSREPSPQAAGPDVTPLSSEDVFFLPGAIEISRLRQMQSLQRAPGGRKLLHRFMSSESSPRCSCSAARWRRRPSAIDSSTPRGETRISVQLIFTRP